MSPAKTDNRISSIHVLSTGTAKQHKEHRYGSRLPALWWVFTSRSWIDIPLNVFALEHRDGLVLFDAGMDPAIATDPNYVSSAIGRLFMRNLFRFEITSDDTLAAKLAGLGFSAGDVSKVIVSHLHFDHVGGIADVPQAELLVSRDEWQQLSGPHPERNYIFREHIELPGAKWQPIDFQASNDPLFAPFGGCYDVTGDGSMILLPTPGHTPGSMSMLVRAADIPPVLFIGDLTYEADLLMNDQVPGTGDAALLRSSFAKVRALKAQIPDLLILASHDPKAAEALKETSL